MKPKYHSAIATLCSLAACPSLADAQEHSPTKAFFDRLWKMGNIKEVKQHQPNPTIK